MDVGAIGGDLHVSASAGCRSSSGQRPCSLHVQAIEIAGEGATRLTTAFASATSAAWVSVRVTSARIDWSDPRLPSGFSRNAFSGFHDTTRSRAPRASNSCATWVPK